MHHIVTFPHAIEKYPPILSAINIFLARGDTVSVLGYCGERKIKEEWAQNGITYSEVIKVDNSAPMVIKLYRYILYKRRVQYAIEGLALSPNDLIWVYGNNNIWLLHSLFKRFRCIAYMFEMPRFSTPIKYRLLSPRLDYAGTLKSAWRNVCCEYNRAAITKAFFGLSSLPAVIPNKPHIKNTTFLELQEISDSLYCLTQNKKVILYQGIFNYPERRLEELCEAINYLPKEYCILLLGGSGPYRDYLQNKYEGDRVIFHDFIPFPNYLSVTKRCHIGFLTYFSQQGDISSVLNTLYCAPNKIFEYASFGLPFVSNDIPAINAVLDRYRIGRVAKEYNAKGVALEIMEISRSYDLYSAECIEFYESVNTSNLLSQIIEAK